MLIHKLEETTNQPTNQPTDAVGEVADGLRLGGADGGLVLFSGGGGGIKNGVVYHVRL